MLRNNAQQTRRDSAYFSVQLQPIKVPAHYAFLLITQEMASSPLLQPACDVCRLILDYRRRDSRLGAEVSRTHLRNQLFDTVGRRSEWGCFEDRSARKAPLTPGRMDGLMLGSVPRVYFVS